MASKMQQNMKTAKTKERMQEKLRKKAQERKTAQVQNTKEDLGEIKQVKDVFVWNDENSVTTGKPKSGKKG